MFFLIDRSGLPEGLKNVVRAMYRLVFVYAAENCELVLYEVLSGILQGCPLSGTLFILAINPLLEMLNSALPSETEATIVACADDIGIALQDLRSSRLVDSQFVVFEQLSALTLKPSKCVLVAAAMSRSEFVPLARSVLADVCPGWLGLGDWPGGD